MEEKQVSSCCGASFHSSCADEGTCCYVCDECGKPCDAVCGLCGGDGEIEEMGDGDNFEYDVIGTHPCPQCHEE